MFESKQEFEKMSQQLEQYQRWATDQSQHAKEPEVDPSGIDKPDPMNYIETEPISEWLPHSVELEKIVKLIVPREVTRMDQDLRKLLKFEVDEQAKKSDYSDRQINQCFADNQLPNVLNSVSLSELPSEIL